MRENRTGIPIPRAPSAPARPTRPTGVRARFQSEAAAGVPFAAATPKRQAPVWPSREGVATMRGRNTMRFSAPTREPPGGRPSRGAKLKGRGCTRQRDARYENRLGGMGAAKKAPSEQGATKAAGLGAEDARLEPRQWSAAERFLEPRQWSAAERLSRDRRRKRRCCARAATEKSARQLSIFFYCRLLYPCAHQGRRKKRRRREHRFPPRFFIGWAVRWCVSLFTFFRFLRYAY